MDMDGGTRRTSAAAAWRWAAALGLMGLAVVVTRGAWADIYHIAWVDEEASQVWLAPIVAAWLVWVRRGQWGKLRMGSSVVGPAMMVAGWMMGTVGFEYDVQAFWHGGAVLTVMGGLLTVVGVDVLRRFLPAFLVLVFLIPVPGMLRQRIAIPLQGATASAAAFVFDLLGTAVQQSGSVLIYRGHEVAVAEACNGMRMVFALILVSFALAFALELRTWARVLIIGLSPVVALASNVVRLVPTVWVYGRYPAAVGDVFHVVSGWVMLVVALLLLMGLVVVLRWANVPVMRQAGQGKVGARRRLKGEPTAKASLA